MNAASEQPGSARHERGHEDDDPFDHGAEPECERQDVNRGEKRRNDDRQVSMIRVPSAWSLERIGCDANHAPRVSVFKRYVKGRANHSFIDPCPARTCA